MGSLTPYPEPLEERHLGGVYGSDHAIYPAYVGGAHGPFAYTYTQGAHASHAQASRAIPVAGTMETVILPDTTNIPYLKDYHRRTYGEKHTGDGKNMRFIDASSHPAPQIRSILEERRCRLVALNPFDGLDDGQFYIDPHVLAEINDKRNIHQLTDQTPRRIKIRGENTRVVMRVLLDEGFLQNGGLFLKGPTGNTGDAVVPIKPPTSNGQSVANGVTKSNGYHEGNGTASWEGQIDAALGKLRGEQEIIAEEAVLYDKNYNIQLQVSSDGTVRFVGASEQVTSSQGEYLGNIIDLRGTAQHVPGPVMALAMQIVQAAHRKGWHGVAGLDILYSESQQNATFIDPNFRLNGSTAAKLLLDTIQKHADGRYMRNMALHTHAGERIEQAMRRPSVQTDIDEGRMFVFGGARGADEHDKLYAGVVGSTLEELARRVKALSQAFAAH